MDRMGFGAMQLVGPGVPDVLVSEDVPMPDRSATEIRIKVRVCGVQDELVPLAERWRPYPAPRVPVRVRVRGKT